MINADNQEFLSKATYEKWITGGGKESLAAFNNNIFKQLDPELFQTIAADTFKTLSEPRKIYKAFVIRAKEAQAGFFGHIRNQSAALKGERSWTAEKVGEVMDQKRERLGYVEIGFPGRMVRSLKEQFPLKGQIVVINDKERVSDIAQWGGVTRPYDRFVEMGDYRPLTEALGEKSEESVDVVSCFIGLHHCPPVKLDGYLQSIKDVLRPGGVFLLRDHDADGEKMQEFCSVIHSVFNAGTGVPAEEEEVEIRNFQSMEYWINKLEEHGLIAVSKPVARDDDPTKNQLVKFVRVDGDQAAFVREAMISEGGEYTRPGFQTHYTTSEWCNVEEAQRVGSKAQGQPFYEYPYLSQIAEFWKACAKSIRQTARQTGVKQLLTAEYTLQNVVLITAMSVEYLAKGFFFTPLWIADRIFRWLPLPKIAEDSPWKKPAQVYSEYLLDYGNSLEHTPFYRYKYIPWIKTFWKSFAENWKAAIQQENGAKLLFSAQTTHNVLSGVVLTVEMAARWAFSALINLNYGDTDDADTRVIRLIVESDRSDFSGISDKISVIAEGSGFQGIESPRYQEFQEVLAQLAEEGIRVHEIAGNKKIQIDLALDKGADLGSIEGVEKCYERKHPMDDTKKIAAVTVEVEKLHEVLNTEPFANNIHRVYDY